jgi:hypothetical protein
MIEKPKTKSLWHHPSLKLCGPPNDNSEKKEREHFACPFPISERFDGSLLNQPAPRRLTPSDTCFREHVSPIKWLVQRMWQPGMLTHLSSLQ